MSDDRSPTGPTAADEDAYDDDDLADVLAAELERYATGNVPVVPAVRPEALAPPEPLQPLAVPRIEDPAALRRPRVRDTSAFAERAAEIDRAVRAPQPQPDETPSPSFRRAERPTGRRSTTGPVLQQVPVPTADDLPVKRRSGFRPPPIVGDPTPVEPIDRVLPPTGPVTLPEPTASLLDAMISDSTPTRPARHAAPPTDPVPQVGAIPDPLRTTGRLPVPDPLYADWERSLRDIGKPPAPWELDDRIVPTGGDPDLPTMAVPVQRTGPLATPAPRAAPEPAQPAHRGAHALPLPEAEIEAAEQPPARRRSGRRRAAAPEPDPEPEPAPTALVLPADVDAEGLDEVAVDYPVVSAATTGAIDLPDPAPRPRTAPVIIERMRTAILQLPVVPASPTGSGAAALVGRWLGAFASPLVLVLGFALVGAGAGAAAAVAVLAGAVLAVPALVRSAAWAATAGDDGDLQEAAVLGAGPGRIVAGVLLAARIGAAGVALLLTGTTVGAWADRTGALGLSSSTASLVGCAAVGLGALLIAALPTRATAALALLAAALGAIGTLLVALLLAPTGSASAPTTPGGVVACVVAGFVAVGLLLVLCGPDTARWRTDIARPASSAVGAVVALGTGAVLVVAGTVIAARLGSGASAVDEFAGALSNASASVLAGPLLVVLLLSALTLPALVLRSAGASAARLLGGGRPVRLGTVAAGLLALAVALGVLAGGADPQAVALSAAALLGVPVAAWAGVLALPPARGRGATTALVLLVAVLAGYALSDGLVPGAGSPVLDAIGLSAATGLRGSPVVGVVVALGIGVIAGLVGRAGTTGPVRPVAGPADTVEG